MTTVQIVVAVPGVCGLLSALFALWKMPDERERRHQEYLDRWDPDRLTVARTPKWIERDAIAKAMAAGDDRPGGFIVQWPADAGPPPPRDALVEAKRAYVEGRIDIAEFERRLDECLRPDAGQGQSDLPYCS
jgi:hypothetical protein